jgi:hypothetical protein
VRDWAERLVYVLPRCELHLYEGCSHLVVLEAPADLRELLLRWFDRIRAGELPSLLDGDRASGSGATGPRGAESGSEGVETGSEGAASGSEGDEPGSLGVETGSEGNEPGPEGNDRIIRHRPARFKELAPRPPWYPEDSPWPPVGGELPDGWQEAMDDFARGKGLDQAPVIPDHRDFAPPGSGSSGSGSSGSGSSGSGSSGSGSSGSGLGGRRAAEVSKEAS